MEYNTKNDAIIIHYNSVEMIYKFLKDNPMWISGFVSGEGCFTGYLSLDKKALWGLQPGLDFNITQSSTDKMLLKAINLYYNNKGGIYDKPNNVSVIAIRNVKILEEIIVPFFRKYHLVGIKSYQFERWRELVYIYYNKKHLGRNIENKKNIIKFAEICRELNVRRNVNSRKVKRIDIIINWLNSLESFPTFKDKLNLYKLIEESKISK